MMLEIIFLVTVYKDNYILEQNYIGGFSTMQECEEYREISKLWNETEGDYRIVTHCTYGELKDDR